MKKYDIIIENDSAICYNKKASSISAIRIGGALDVVIMPRSEASLIAALNNTDTDRIVLGNTTNVLFADGGVRQEIILTGGVKGISIDGDVMRVSAGEPLSNAAQTAKKHYLSGLEYLSGIPGSIGGAVAMNAGSFGSTISDVVISAQVWQDGEVKEISAEDMCFGYRDSVFLHSKAVILSVNIRLSQDNPILISRRMKEVRAKRAQSQPTGYSLGSVFRQYNGVSAGWYIDNCGLKGRRIGRCMISDKHANIIVNTGDGRADDYIDLMRIMADEVYRQYGIELQKEVRLIGEFER